MKQAFIGSLLEWSVLTVLSLSQSLGFFDSLLDAGGVPRSACLSETCGRLVYQLC